MRKLKSVPPVQKYRPIFIWRECCNCRHSFVREFGWRYWEGFKKLRLYYLCSNCAKTEKEADAKKFFRENRHRPKLKMPPPGGSGVNHIKQEK